VQNICGAREAGFEQIDGNVCVGFAKRRYPVGSRPRMFRKEAGLTPTNGRGDAERIILCMTCDLPASFDTAEIEFSRFLAAHGYPPHVVWTLIEDVLADESGYYFIRRNSKASRSALESRYLSGIPQGLGVELRAICASEMHTFACVNVPVDSTDAQCRMIPPSLKMACPDRLRQGSLVSGTPQWWFLKLKHGKRSAILQYL
jgi:hypothetical protein